MSSERSRRSSAVHSSSATVPSAPPLPAALPAPRPLQRARDAAYRFIGYPPSRPSSAQSPGEDRPWLSGRLPTLGATENAMASHKTGLEINAIAVNGSGTHVLLGGKEIFKTVKVENGVCIEEINLRTAIRSTPTSASGRPRQTYSIDIADVAWAKGNSSHFVAAATSSGKIILYDLGHAGIQAAQLHEHFRQVHKVTFNPHSGNLLLSGSQDGTVRLWDIRDARDQASTLRSKRKYSGQSDGVRDVKWSPTDGVDFAFGTDSGWVQCWDMRNLNAPKVKIPAHALSCNIVDWHPDGKHLASAGSDKTVRVWDVSGHRRGKASWEIKTPYPVLNARWRPSCESSMPADNGARQCTQLVTGYDREHPTLHLWDFRRPALPFREMVPYPSAPTDLTWHSRDLLWTVGREGVFLQADIQHASKVIDKRNLQTFDVSSSGEVNFVVQKRGQQRRSPNLSSKRNTTTFLPGTNDSQSTTDAATGAPIDSVAPRSSPLTHVSRSWQDDSLDHSFLSIRPARQSKRSNSGVKASSSSHNPAILVLDRILHNRMSFSPQQLAVRGILPYHLDPKVFRFLASNYARIPHLAAEADEVLAGSLLRGLQRNHDAAETAGLYQLAQTWKIVGFAADNFLKAGAGSVSAVANSAGAPAGGDGGRRGVEQGGEGSPFALGRLLPELLRYHTGRGDAQTATQMLLLLVPLLPCSCPLPDDVAERNTLAYQDALSLAGSLPQEIAAIIDAHLAHLVQKGLNPLQVESILCTYHEQLLQNRLFAEAASIRKLAFPAFPSVYEDYMTDNHVHLKCSKCGKPVERGAEKHKCEGGDTGMEACPYCWEVSSPFGMGRLMATCLLCNHSMHAGCAKEWFGRGGGDGCAVEGCLCRCVAQG
ncbi:SEA (Seh1-associated) complex subunit [Friedmanniomyces endolithicus]|uniref:SEA (Seh1-associated) complex subunit n=1 Tax=Friedmanniomyces endolithicus TaxID=329885 RepID=A0AAN6K4H1_9PEZI|nr:SEA (Seh1-associated) complex subunit [Friedmanniomyces endolithicus]KAK0957795.1 SEA (Seh1-associated) complex subunit [Friedmanniomyces endolithicus]KAK0992878.1 SEA (Seh1-associated) complex subunit [Friedmanniomyces endolithicus]KAK1055024.1 SEA (Seh1-associated) complex subunit [Friedmanniomyces endolithicus]